MNKRRGFTLLECLAYMAIVSIVLTAANVFISYILQEHEIILEKVEEIKELHEIS